MTNNQSCVNAGTGTPCSEKPPRAIPDCVAAQTADDALELLRATQERINHMKALFSAIKADFKHGRSLNIEDLADLGGFLGYDWANYVDCQVGDLQRQLDLLELAQ